MLSVPIAQIAHTPVGHGDDESRSVVVLSAVQNKAGIYDKKFEASFLATLSNSNMKGLLTTHLFYDLPSTDPKRSFSNLAYDARRILSGGMAWERRIDEAVTQNTQSSGYWNKDQSVIAYAIKNGVLNNLPQGDLSFVSYGGGDSHAFEGNELQIMREVIFSRQGQHEFCAVDILERFAFGCAVKARDALGIVSHGILGDFIYNGRLAIPRKEDKAPIIMIFGGPFENTPIIDGGISPVDATALAWAKLNIQHGQNVVVLKTVDSNQTPDLANGAYAPSKNFEAFLLSAFARAVQQGIITDPQYDVFDNWRMTSSFNNVSNSIELAAECKKDHVLPLLNGNMQVRVGDRHVITLSHKWDKVTHESIAKRAGFDCQIIEEPENTNLLMVARAIRQPDADLMALMPAR